MTEHRQATRREFLRTGAKGVAAAAFLSSCSPSPTPDGGSPPAERGRPTSTRTLGRTGLTLPIVSMGTYATELVPAALDRGIVYVHTSSSEERNQERRLGRALQGRRRDSFVLGTSPDLPARFPGGGAPSMDVGVEFDPGLIEKSMHDSLGLLGLDHVDIYYLASVGTRRTALHERYIRAYEKLKQEGLTRFIGVVTHSNEPDVIRAAVESRAWDIVVTAYNFRQSHRGAVAEAIAAAADARLGVIAMKTQAGVYWDRLRLRKINMKAALKWVLQNEHVHTAIPAFSNYDELQEDLEVIANPEMTPEERSDLKLGEAAGLPGVFCQQCARCLPQCPSDVNVTALMRAAMYDIGYRNAARARHVLEGWAPADIPCARCSRCSVQCALGLDVRAAALDLVPLLARG
jgi:predicted aldo/keto reductase-like oxidoreductase